MHSLIAHAERLGLHVAYRNLGRANGYLLGGNLVVINYRRALTTQRVTLAHEVGHWFHGHDWTGDHDRVRDELQADLYGARLLISPVEYALAAAVVGEHPGALAQQLGVSRRFVQLRQTDFERDARIFEVVDEWRSA